MKTNPITFKASIFTNFFAVENHAKSKIDWTKVNREEDPVTVEEEAIEDFEIKLGLDKALSHSNNSAKSFHIGAYYFEFSNDAQKAFDNLKKTGIKAYIDPNMRLKEFNNANEKIQEIFEKIT